MTAGLGRGLKPDRIAESILDAVVEHYAAAGVPLPDRQYVAAGEALLVPWDAEQVTVSLSGIGWGVAQEAFAQTVQLGAQMSAQALRHGVFITEIVRAVPLTDETDNLPAVADLQAAGMLFLRDAGLLSQAMVVAAAQVAQGLDRSATARPGVVDPRGPEGGFVAVSGTMIVTLSGLE